VNTVTLTLGRLERVDPRTVWQGEASHFTPWLARPENLRLLADTIELPLELEAQETNVGPFRADILCKDMSSGDWVLIENQLERTDHAHLGQLLTYAAGLNAVTIVWVAQRFTEEHRATLDWLNAITDRRFNFFGLEVELWRIDQSAPAPKFNVVSKPNDWSKRVTEGTASIELSDAQQLQQAFWSEFVEHVKSSASRIRPTKALPQNWMTFAIGRTGFVLTAVASMWDSEVESYDSNEVRAEFVILDSRAKKFFAVLKAQQHQIETELGHALIWADSPDRKQSKAYVRRSADLRDRNTWPELHEWLRRNLETLDQVFRPRVRALTVSEDSAERTTEAVR
jgi:hypothetical protein